MSHRHPPEETLNTYAKGDIDEKLAVLVSAHLGHCPYCSEIVKKQEALHADELLQVEPFKRPDFEAVFDRITQSHVVDLQKLEVEQGHNFPSQMEFQDVAYDIPRSLRPLAARKNEWKNIMSHVSLAKVEMRGRGRFYFVYLQKGARLSQHSHKGNEFSYVIAGSFNDETNEYVTGDFAWFDRTDTHAPQTFDPDGCLLAVAIDAPLQFKKGLVRLLNPLGMWPY